jgi:class 3 adenylate cyclase
MPPVKYAKSGDVHIAYMSLGEGPEEIVMTPGISTHLEGLWAVPARREFYQRVSELGRLTIFDKRGTGMSDRDARFTFEERIDDIRAVMDAAGITSAHLMGLSEGGPMSILFAATYPERVRSLFLYGTYPAFRRQADYPEGVEMSISQFTRFLDTVESAYAGEPDGLRWWMDLFTPSFSPTDADLAGLAHGLRMGASPGSGRALWEMFYEIDVRHALSSLHLPTAVVHVTGDRVAPIAGGRYLANHIAGARLVELPGTDHWPAPIETLVAELAGIIQAGRSRSIDANRQLATVLFTDFVNSTPTAAGAGDRAWAGLLDRHDAAARRIVAGARGELVKFTGDGLLATFDGPGRAVGCARELVASAAGLGIEMRAGLHAGEIERRGSDVGGIAVNIAARVCGASAGGQVLVSSTVKDLVIGSDLRFESRGEHALKGVAEPWRLFALQN